MKAARLLAERIPGLKTGAFHLVKRLPVAAGIGGGSSDAAAALRLLARLNDLPLSHPAILDAARRTGADVPVCLEARARTMGGTGEVLGPVLRLPRLFGVLVNPGVPIATPDVFGALGLRRGECLRAFPRSPMATLDDRRSSRGAATSPQRSRTRGMPAAADRAGRHPIPRGNARLSSCPHVRLRRHGVRAVRERRCGDGGREQRPRRSSRLVGQVHDPALSPLSRYRRIRV